MPGLKPSIEHVNSFQNILGQIQLVYLWELVQERRKYISLQSDWQIFMVRDIAQSFDMKNGSCFKLKLFSQTKTNHNLIIMYKNELPL